MKFKMLGKEMETYLLANGHDIRNSEYDIDNSKVVNEAIELGYDSYQLQGDGQLNDTLIFIKKHAEIYTIQTATQATEVICTLLESDVINTGEDDFNWYFRQKNEEYKMRKPDYTIHHKEKGKTDWKYFSELPT